MLATAGGNMLACWPQTGEICLLAGDSQGEYACLLAAARGIRLLAGRSLGDYACLLATVRVNMLAYWPQPGEICLVAGHSRGRMCLFAGQSQGKSACLLTNARAKLPAGRNPWGCCGSKRKYACLLATGKGNMYGYLLAATGEQICLLVGRHQKATQWLYRRGWLPLINVSSCVLQLGCTMLIAC